MKKILIIEDEAQVRDNLQQILELEGFAVLAAENGLLGVEIAKKLHPDLIICDIMMPELDGYGVLSTLQQDPVASIIPLIFLSAKAHRADLRYGMELGADDYLTKPFTPTELIRAIQSRLKRQSHITQSYTQQIQQAEKGIDYLIHYDTVTQLPNQLALEEQFQKLQPQADQQALTIPLLLIRLDQFNRVNDCFGHTLGESLIKIVSDRLKVHLSNCNQHSLLAHLRADQFALLLNPTGCHQEAVAIAERILDWLTPPFELNGHRILVTGSIGIAFYGRDDCSLNKLITKAEVALGQAKQQGGNCYCRYQTEMQIIPSERLLMETSLWQALERSELQVYYQPQVDLRTGKITSAEALVRWHHPEQGPISPARFIPWAEETGLIIPIGEWVLQTACTQVRLWQKRKLPSIQIAVNLSARQFSQPGLSQRVTRLLAETGLDPHFLDLELTESTLMSNINQAIVILQELKKSGIQISIDDFGIGYSSLGYLQKLPFNTIKIDQCFVRNIDINPQNAAITQAIIQMAHSLRLKVIAEGVETETELAFLQHQNCDAIQGYLFSRPLPVQQFEELLIADRRLCLTAV
jgi:diguanylate cyclase